MHLQRIGRLVLPLLAASVSTPLFLTVPAILGIADAIAQTSIDRKSEQNPAAKSAMSGSFK